MKRSKIPYVHTGIRRSYTKLSLKLDQDEFCQSAKPVKLEAHRWSEDDSSLRPDELTAFGGIIGILLWLCQTRLDAIADVVILQTNVMKTQLRPIKTANNLFSRFQKLAENAGLYFPLICPP